MCPICSRSGIITRHHLIPKPFRGKGGVCECIDICTGCHEAFHLLVSNARAAKVYNIKENIFGDEELLRRIKKKSRKINNRKRVPELRMKMRSKLEASVKTLMRPGFFYWENRTVIA